MFANIMGKVRSFFNRDPKKEPVFIPTLKPREMSKYDGINIVEFTEMGLPKDTDKTTANDTKKTEERHENDIYITQAKGLTTLFSKPIKSDPKLFHRKKTTQKRQWEKWKKRR